MDSKTLKLADLEENARQLTADIAKKKEELNQVKMEISLLLLNISKDGRVTKAKPEDPQNNRSLSPYGVFPELVWLKISSKIQDKHDWLNLYFASSKLMELLQNEMLERMFPQVFSHLQKYLKRKDVINLCAADRKFETAIISWVQTRWLPPHWSREGGYDDCTYDQYLAEKIPGYSPIVGVESSKQIQRITNELLEGGSGSLIPFGIIFNDYQERVQLWAPLKTFLQSFGTRIWYFKFISHVDNYDPTQFMDIIIEYLKLTPNVIRLKLSIPFPTPLIHSRRFPHLTKLKVLSLNQESHETYIDFLRLHANQLEYLSIKGKHDPEESFRYPNLKKLRLTAFMPFEIPEVPSRLDLFFQAPLTKLYTKVTALGFAEFGRRFLQFNHFGETLEDLYLTVEVDISDCYDREENDMTWIVNINLPKLKRLTITGLGAGEHLLFRMHSFQDSHFPFPSDWVLSCKDNKNIFNTNIWSTLSNLEELKLRNLHLRPNGIYIYTRQQYNQYHEDPLNFNF